MVTGMLQVFSLDVDALLDTDATLSFVTSLVFIKFDILSDILIEPFSVRILIGDSVVARCVFGSCPIYFPMGLLGLIW